MLRYTFSLLTLLFGGLLGLTSPAMADILSELRFSTEQRIYTWPPDAQLPGIGRAGVERTEAELKKLKQPFYLVLAATLPGRGDPGQRVEALSDGLAERWARDGYNLGTDNLFVVTFQPRKFSLLVGARWHAEYGFNDVRLLDRYLALFTRYAGDNPPDPLGGALSMAQKLDADIFDRSDPERIAQRAAQERQRLLKERHAQLKQQLVAAESALARSAYIIKQGAPTIDLAPYPAAIERAQAQLSADDPAQLKAALTQLEESVRPLEIHQRAWQQQLAEKKRAELFTAISLILLLFGLILGIIWSRSRYLALRSLFEGIDEDWREKLENATGRYVDAYGTRDQLLSLLHCEGETKRKLDEITKIVDEIYTYISAMQQHLERLRAQARSAHWLWHRPLKRGLAQIEGSFEFDTQALDEADLFAPAQQRIRIDTPTLLEQLNRWFAESLEGWQLLEEAARFRLLSPESHFPHTLFDELWQRAQAAQLPTAWLQEHPLYGDDASDERVWAEAYSTDALVYMRSIAALHTQHQAVADQLDALITAQAATLQARQQILARWIEQRHLVSDPQDDPQHILHEARRAHQLLKRALQQPPDAAQALQFSERAISLYQQTAARFLEIEEGQRETAPTLHQTKELLESIEAQLGPSRTQAQEAQARYLNTQLLQEIERVQQQLSFGQSLRAEAHEALNTAHILDAWRLAQRAQQAAQTAQRTLEEVHNERRQLEAQEARYIDEAAQMPEHFKRSLQQLQRYESGAQLRSPWQASALSYPANFEELLADLSRHRGEWATQVQNAKAAYQHQQLLKKQAEERARQAALRASRSSHSWSSSSSRSSSRSSSSSNRSSSSRSRSGGSRSSGSRSRSGGSRSSGSRSRSGGW